MLVIVPAYNEVLSVGRVVEELARAGNCDLLVVDDGSTDRTAESVPPHATVVRLPFNLGIGGAMQTGYRYAAEHGYSVAVQVDGDGQHPADQVAELVARLGETGADLVLGSRFLEETGYRLSPARTVGVAVLRGLLCLLTGRTYTDCTSGFRAANRRVIEAFAHWYPDDYPEPEVILLLHRAGFRIEETAVRMSERTTGRSSIPNAQGIFYVLKVCFALLLDLVRRPWPKELEAR